MGLIAQNQLRNHATRNGHQQVVTAVLHPVVATGRVLQAMSTPVIHHILVRTVLWRHTRALHPIVVRPCTHAFGLPGRHAVRVRRMLRLCLIVRSRRLMLPRGLRMLRAFLLLFLRAMPRPLRAMLTGLRKSAQR